MVSFIQSKYLGFGSSVVVPGRRDGRAVAAFGAMGGNTQPQGHVQMALRLFAYGQDPRTACDAPRWHVTEKDEVALEPGFEQEIRGALARRGHHVVPRPPVVLFQDAQIIQARVGEVERAGPRTVYWGDSDPCKDGQAVAS